MGPDQAIDACVAGLRTMLNETMQVERCGLPDGISFDSFPLFFLFFFFLCWPPGRPAALPPPLFPILPCVHRSADQSGIYLIDRLISGVDSTLMREDVN